jgi:hypothetical protein
MKVVLFLYFVSIFFSCKSQHEMTNNNKNKNKMRTPVVTKDFEKFDFQKFDSIQGFSIYTLEDGTHLELLKEADEYLSRETPKDSYFTLVKIFYLNGNVKEKGLSINSGDFRKGTFYYFDESGTLIREEDNDLLYKYSFEDLLKYLEKEKIPLTMGFIGSGIHTSIYKKNDTDGVKWLIRWLKETSSLPAIIEEIIIDGKNGNVISKREIEYRHYPSF